MLAIGLAVSGCSSSAPDSIAYADDAPVVVEPAPDAFLPAEQQLITFHATWLCEMQRRTFRSLDGTEVARTVALNNAGIDSDVYDTFLVDELPRQVVRNAVLWTYQQQC